MAQIMITAIFELLTYYLDGRPVVAWQPYSAAGQDIPLWAEEAR